MWQCSCICGRAPVHVAGLLCMWQGSCTYVWQCSCTCSRDRIHVAGLVYIWQGSCTCGRARVHVHECTCTLNSVHCTLTLPHVHELCHMYTSPATCARPLQLVLQHCHMYKVYMLQGHMYTSLPHVYEPCHIYTSPAACKRPLQRVL